MIIVEVDPSGRAKCQTCKQIIPKGTKRLKVIVPMGKYQGADHLCLQCGLDYLRICKDKLEVCEDELSKR